MRWRGKALYLVNRAVALGGVRLEPDIRDLDNRFLDERSLDDMLTAMVARIDSYLSQDCIFPLRRTTITKAEVRAFYDAYLGVPYRVSRGGSQLANLLWLHVLRRALGADLVIDSGTYMGGSAWALSWGSDPVQVHSFDITHLLLQRREPRVTYHLEDWATAPIGDLPADTTLAYFDDHIDQARRVREAHAKGLRFVVFDDDVEATAVPDRCKAPFTLPKLSFVFDDRLEDGREITWRARGERHSWRVDRAYLDGTRALIEKVQRVPNLGDITGVDHLPFRLVLLKQG